MNIQQMPEISGQESGPVSSPLGLHLTTATASPHQFTRQPLIDVYS